MRFQVQEMARAERMLRDEQIAREIETFNDLIPADGELSGTLFIEITDDEALRYWLPRLVGIHEHLHIVVGAAIVTGYAEDVDRLTRPDTTSTVHYLKFAFTPDQQQTFETAPVRLVIDHPEYQVDVTLSDEQRDELVGDFAA
jgi:hypothetical protein